MSASSSTTLHAPGIHRALCSKTWHGLQIYVQGLPTSNHSSASPWLVLLHPKKKSAKLRKRVKALAGTSAAAHRSAAASSACAAALAALQVHRSLVHGRLAAEASSSPLRLSCWTRPVRCPALPAHSLPGGKSIWPVPIRGTNRLEGTGYHSILMHSSMTSKVDRQHVNDPSENHNSRRGMAMS